MPFFGVIGIYIFPSILIICYIVYSVKLLNVLRAAAT